MAKLNVLMTGAGGRIGPHLVGPFQEQYHLRNFDRRPVPGDPDTILGDLQDFAALLAAMRGMDVLVHLAATSDEAPFVENLVPNNLVGLYHAFEAARLARVRRIVFASTCQTMLAYPRDATVATTDPPRPSTMYGATKVFGEVLGRWYHDKHGLEFVGIRIGSFQPYESERLRRRGPGLLWLSPRDCVSLFRRAIEKPDVGYALVNGTSITDHEFLSLRPARELLQWQPQDDAGSIDRLPETP